MGNSCCGGKKSGLPASKGGDHLAGGMRPVEEMSQKERLAARDKLEKERKQQVLNKLKKDAGFIPYDGELPIRVSPTPFEIEVITSQKRHVPTPPPMPEPKPTESPAPHHALSFSDPDISPPPRGLSVEEPRGTSASPAIGSEARVEEIIVQEKTAVPLPDGRIIVNAPLAPPLPSPSQPEEEQDARVDVDAPNEEMARHLIEKAAQSSSARSGATPKSRHEESQSAFPDPEEKPLAAEKSEQAEEQEESVVAIDSSSQSSKKDDHSSKEENVRTESPMSGAVLPPEDPEDHFEEMVDIPPEGPGSRESPEEEETEPPIERVKSKSASSHSDNEPHSQPLDTDERVHNMQLTVDTDETVWFSSHPYAKDPRDGSVVVPEDPGTVPRRPPPPVPPLSDEDEKPVAPPAEDEIEEKGMDMVENAKEKLSEMVAPEPEGFFGGDGTEGSQTEYQS